MKRIGLIGGMSWESSAEYYRLINELVREPIYDELCVGVLSEQSRTAYQGVINRLVAAGVEGVILGCTEVELLIQQEHSPVPVFPTASLHAKAAVELALS